MRIISHDSRELGCPRGIWIESVQQVDRVIGALSGPYRADTPTHGSTRA